MTGKPADDSAPPFDLTDTDAKAKLAAAKAKLKPITVNESVPLSNSSPAEIELDDRILKESRGWLIREALLYSYHWGNPTMTVEDFVSFKQDCYITEILSDPDTVIYVKEKEARSYLGK